VSTQVSLDNKTIAKLAIAVTAANHFVKEAGELIGGGPLTRKVLETLDEIDKAHHFADYKPAKA